LERPAARTACLTAGTCCLLPIPFICTIVKRCYFDWQTNLKCEHPRDAESDTSEYDSILPEGVSSHDLRGEPLWLLKLAGWIETVVNAGAVHQGALQAMTNLNVDRAAPVMLRIYKEERTLEIWKQDRTGKYVLLKAYPICNYSGTLG